MATPGYSGAPLHRAPLDVTPLGWHVAILLLLGALVLVAVIVWVRRPCPWSARVSALVDGERRDEVLDHLLVCPECARAMEDAMQLAVLASMSEGDR